MPNKILEEYLGRMEDIVTNYVESDVDFTPKFKTLLQEVYEAGYKEGVNESIKVVSTHPEGEGDWCDTGSDMDWDCRSDCVKSGVERLYKLLPTNKQN